ATQIDPIGLRKRAWIAIRAHHTQENKLTFLEDLAPNVHLFDDVTRHDDDPAVVTQQLLNRIRQEAPIAAKLLEVIRLVEQGSNAPPKRTAACPCSRRHETRDDGGDLLRRGVSTGGQNETRDQVVNRRGHAFLDETKDVVPHFPGGLFGASPLLVGKEWPDRGG